jgi:hypothetical protein
MGEVTVSARDGRRARERERGATREKNAGQDAACRFFSAPRSTWDALWDEIVFSHDSSRERGAGSSRAPRRARSRLEPASIGKRGGPSARRDGAVFASR